MGYKESARDLRKHGIEFSLAMRIFADPHIVTEIDETERGELRYWSIGEVSGRVLVVVHTTTVEEEDVEIVRIVSARKATRSERRDYEEDA
jgi:uncharacterized DUF497 family protein